MAKDHEIIEEIAKQSRALADAELERLKGEIDGRLAEQFLLGVLTKIDYDNAHNKLLKYALLYQYKQKKEYLKGGKSWEAFLESIGEERRTVDNIFKDLRPLFDEFHGKFSGLSGLPFNKVRYLGKSIQEKFSGFEDDCLVFDGEKIPLDPEHKEDIEAVIDKMKEVHRKEREEIEAALKARDRILEEKERVIVNQEKELAKLNRTLEERGFKPGEEEFLGEIENLRTAFGLIAGKLDPESVADFVHPERGGTERAKAAYMGLVQTIARYAHGLWNDAQLIFGDPELDGGWTQPESPAQGAPDPNPDTPASGKPGLTIIK